MCFLIIGKKCSGKSTLASKIAKKLNLPIYENCAKDQPTFKDIDSGIIMSQTDLKDCPDDVIKLREQDEKFVCSIQDLNSSTCDIISMLEEFEVINNVKNELSSYCSIINNLIYKDIKTYSL